MLPRDQYVACICIAVHSIERVTLELLAPEAPHSSHVGSHGRSLDIGLAGIEVGGPGKSADPSTPFAMAARDWLRRYLLGQHVTYSPSLQRTGFLFNCPPQSITPGKEDNDEFLVNAQLVALGYATVRATSIGPVHSTAEQCRMRLLVAEDLAKQKAIGIHGLGRTAEATWAMKPFPAETHPYHALLVHHLVPSVQKISVERVVSPSMIEGVLVTSHQELRIRVVGVLPPKDEALFLEARSFVNRTLLHRTTTVHICGFDETTQSVWGSFASNPIEQSLVEQGLMFVDYRTVASCGGITSDLLEAEARAKQARCGVWARARTRNPTQHEECSFVGVVTGVVDEVTVDVVVDVPKGSPSSARGSTEKWAVRLSHLGAPDPPLFTRTIDCGRVVRYSARSFFGRETLRSMVIGQHVAVTGVVVDNLQSQLPAPLSSSRCCVARMLLVERGCDVADSLKEKEKRRGLFPAVGFTHTYPAYNGLHELPSPDEILVLCMEQANCLEASSTAPDKEPEEVTVPHGSIEPMDILYVETAAQLDLFLASPNRLTLHQPLGCIVEGVKLDDNGLTMLVYVPSVGVALPVQLEGIRIPPLGGDGTVVAGCQTRLAQASLSRALNDFLCRSVQHRNATACLLRYQPNKASAVQATMLLDGIPSLAHELVAMGFAVATNLLTCVPYAPSVGLLAAQASAQLKGEQLWSEASMPLIEALSARRLEVTKLEHVAHAADFANPISIVPLAWLDHVTFTYRLASEGKTFVELQACVAKAAFAKNTTRICVQDIVAAPFQGSFYRAEVTAIDQSTETCLVYFVDYGTPGPAPIPLSKIKVSFTKDGKNRLTKWPHLAKRARHGFIAFSVDGMASRGKKNSSKGASQLPSRLYHRCLKMMETLVSFPLVSMFRVYVKDGVDHVLLMPDGVPLANSDLVDPLQLTLWREIDVLQKQALAESKTRERKQELTVVVESGCSEFPTLFEWFATFLGVKDALPSTLGA